jgi:hypothetical protein
VYTKCANKLWRFGKYQEDYSIHLKDIRLIYMNVTKHAPVGNWTFAETMKAYVVKNESCYNLLISKHVLSQEKLAVSVILTHLINNLLIFE